MWLWNFWGLVILSLLLFRVFSFEREKCEEVGDLLREELGDALSSFSSGIKSTSEFLLDLITCYTWSLSSMTLTSFKIREFLLLSFLLLTILPFKLSGSGELPISTCICAWLILTTELDLFPGLLWFSSIFKD